MQLLKQMAVRRGLLPPGHPVHVHIMQCSPCFQAMHNIRVARHRRRTIVGAVSAALIIAASYGVYLEWPRSRALLVQNPAQLERVVVDLRPYTVDRSDRKAGNTPPPLRLLRSRLQAIFYLPVGAEPGSYELRILNSELKTLLSSTVTLSIRNFEAIIETEMDLQDLSPGQYTLALRHMGEGWREYPLFIDPLK